MGAAEPRARRGSPLRPGYRPPLPARHRAAQVAARQVAHAMHVRATGPGAASLRDRRAVRRMTQADLFADPLIAGLEYCEDFIALDEERDLLANLEAMDLAPFRFQGWTGNRKTKSYGWRYDF